MRGKPFEVGNKFGKGRTRGSRNKRTAFMQLMEDHGEEMIKLCKVMAIKGDPTALRLCIERLLPPCRSANSRFRMPPMKTMKDLVKAGPAVAKEMARGRLSGPEADTLSRMIDRQRQLIESELFEKRMERLEKERWGRPPMGRKIV